MRTSYLVRRAQSSAKVIPPRDLQLRQKFRVSREAPVQVVNDRLTMAARGRVFSWEGKPSLALLVKKDCDAAASRALDDVAHHLERNGVRSFVEPSVATEHPQLYTYDPEYAASLHQLVDIVITLGGDGTLLKVSKLFQGQAPPVLAFAMGSLGFMTPFSIEHMEKSLDMVLNQPFRFVQRMRLSCTVFTNPLEPDGVHNYTCLNELSLRAEDHASLMYFDGYVNGHPLTTYHGDGVLVATSSGSTAYSLSSGSSVIHPGVHGILLTPISSRKLSLRSALFPRNSTIRMELNPRSRGNGAFSCDGQPPLPFIKGSTVDVVQSPYPLCTITNDHPTIDWINNLQKLGFGS